jgi:hypothetical protein
MAERHEAIQARQSQAKPTRKEQQSADDASRRA